MKKFFDSRREAVSSGPGSGGAGAGGGAGCGGGGAFIGRVFTIGRYQVTVEETVAEGEPTYTPVYLFSLSLPTPISFLYIFPPPVTFLYLSLLPFMSLNRPFTFHISFFFPSFLFTFYSVFPFLSLTSYCLFTSLYLHVFQFFPSLPVCFPLFPFLLHISPFFPSLPFLFIYYFHFSTFLCCPLLLFPWRSPFHHVLLLTFISLCFYSQVFPLPPPILSFYFSYFSRFH